MGDHRELDCALDDLTAEGNYLDDVVTAHQAAFEIPTASPGWSIGHQIGHLIWTDRITAVACRDRGKFARQAEAFGADPERTIDAGAAVAASGPEPEVLASWRTARSDLLSALRGVPAGSKIPWFGPSMTPASMASIRIMETWAHGLDITDVLGLRPSATARLWHIADLGVQARDFAFSLHGLRRPSAPFRIELLAPSGETWSWGPRSAANRLTGSALDFCFLVTQRRHRVDLALTATAGPAASWLPIAQVFAGPAGNGRSALKPAQRTPAPERGQGGQIGQRGSAPMTAGSANATGRLPSDAFTADLSVATKDEAPMVAPATSSATR